MGAAAHLMTPIISGIASPATIVVCMLFFDWRLGLVALGLLTVGCLALAGEELPALAAPFAYYIVCPAPLANRPKVRAFREWLLGEAADGPQSLADVERVQIERARLVEGRDYLLTQKGEQLPSGMKYLKEYILTIEAGKHIAMMSGTDKGFEVREYFIECESRAAQPAPAALPQTFAEALRLAADQAERIERRRQPDGRRHLPCFGTVDAGGRAIPCERIFVGIQHGRDAEAV